MRTTPLVRFSLLSATCLALLGVVLGQVLAGQIEKRALVGAQQTADLLADGAFRPQLRTGDLGGRPIPPDRLARLNEIARAAKANDRLVRIKIWTLDGTVVYSDDPRVVARRFAVGDDLEEAFSGGRAVSVTRSGRAEQRNERGRGRLLEAYVPLRFARGGPIRGAFEIYAPYEPTAAAISEDQRTLTGVLVVGLAVLWLVLFRIVAGVSKSLRVQARRSRYEADHDPLTGLANRRVLYERLQTCIARAGRGERSWCVLLVVDLDGFKELNDTLGHPTGDEVLRDIGPRLAAALGPGTLLARLGGDEFAVVHTRGDAEKVVEVLQQALEAPFALDGLKVRITASIGLARFPEHGTDAATLLQHADVAMYEAKRERTGWAAYDAERDGNSRERLALAEELRQGITRGELEILYQPKSDLHDGRVIGAEALVRWRHPVDGLLLPGDFLALAEQTGLMRELTQQVLAGGLDQLAAWTRQGLELTLAVNLSVPDLLDARLVDDVAAQLARTGVAPGRLILELTEDAMMRDPKRCAEAMRRLGALGVSLSLDDFGTGYSSLTHLKQLAVDELKIDRSFVSPMTRSPRDAAIVRSTIELARALDLRVVAEGVEDGQTLRDLADCGCDIAQGFFLSRPVPAEDFTALLLASRTERPGEPVGHVATRSA